jgi:DNA-binding Lrp family transcriptional regulator
MKPLFVQIKCELGEAYNVADRMIDAIGEAAEIYSTSGAFDLLVKFHLADDQSIGEFVNKKLHKIPGIRDTYTLMAYRLFVPDRAEQTDETDFRSRG